MNENYTIPHPHDTIFYYADAFGDKVGSARSGLDFQWKTLKSTTNLYMKAIQKSYYLASKSTKGVVSFFAIVSTFILSDIW